MKPAIVRMLRERAVHCTRQRYVVMEYLLRRRVHATADQIYRAVNRSGLRVCRATVYNNVRSLVGARLVREVALDPGAALFEANLDRHHHFVCDDCGRIEDLNWFDVPHVLKRPASGGREIRDYELILRGLCKRCSIHSTQH